MKEKDLPEPKSKSSSNDEKADDYDSDDEPLELSTASLDWRNDPAQSHSDWTIEIHVKATDETPASVATYHVHRCILATGSRKSGYFEALFKSSQEFVEQQTTTSRIELEESAANAQVEGTTPDIYTDCDCLALSRTVLRHALFAI
jgi:hypothetical protein